jgi:hypothetical protein
MLTATVHTAHARSAQHPAPDTNSKPQPAENPAATTFTSRKLDWLNCAAYDRRLEASDIRVALVIAKFINAKTGIARVSDEVIADEAGGISARNVRRSRQRLLDARWVTWKRTQKANIYALRFDNIESILDVITLSRDQRKERRAAQLHQDRVIAFRPSRPPTSWKSS